MKINIIVAVGKENEIGLDNKLLWKSKSDLAHFKHLTQGKPIIMGRKTFESLPGILPGRPHIVVSSKGVPAIGSVDYEASLKRALSRASDYDEVFIIGGASIYDQALPLVDELHISHMDWTGKADTFFPPIDSSDWLITAQIHHSEDIPWVYRKYERRP